jgi:MerR family transcriptional regulator, light-induced transcriptional regulator
LSESELYRIGTVAKLTGISVECLRAWERRHGLEPAERDGRTRYYNQNQLRRLEKIKVLIEEGHPISSLIELSDEQLDARTGLRRPQVNPNRLPQVGLVGPNLLILEQEAEQSDVAEVCQRWVSIDDFVGSRPAERAQLDVVAVQIPSLNADSLQRVQRAAPDCRLLAVYQFANREALSQATEQHGATTLAWPLAWADLMHACATPSGSAARVGRMAPRRYTDHELVDIATRARSRGLDTPRHLVTLITDLNAFADYATQCLTGAADTEAYDRLREDVSYARAQLERALATTIETRAVIA